MGKGNWLLRKGSGKASLVGVSNLNLFCDQFPYSEPPRVVFDAVQVPYDPPEDIYITCTTFRDGQQARPPYTVQQIVDLYEFEHRMAGPNGVIRQAEFFVYTDKDREAIEKCLEKNYKYPEVTGWIRAVKEDFQLVKEIGLKETGILTSCSDYHIFLKLGWDREGALQSYIEVVEAPSMRVLSHGVTWKT